MKKILLLILIFWITTFILNVTIDIDFLTVENTTRAYLTYLAAAMISFIITSITWNSKKSKFIIFTLLPLMIFGLISTAYEIITHMNKGDFYENNSIKKTKTLLVKPSKIYKNCNNTKKFEETSNFFVGNGYFTASDLGEWGGSLKFHPFIGASYIVINKNIKKILKIDGEIFVIAGLAHLSGDVGTIYRLSLTTSNIWVMQSAFNLPSSPKGIKKLTNSTYELDTHKGTIVYNFNKQSLTRPKCSSPPQ